MEDKKIVVNIDSDGNIKAETFGMEGVGCVEELTKLMRDVATNTSSEHKPEFYKNKINNDKKIKVKND